MESHYQKCLELNCESKWSVKKAEDESDPNFNEEIIGWETVPTSEMEGVIMSEGLCILVSITLRHDIGNL